METKLTPLQVALAKLAEKKAASIAVREAALKQTTTKLTLDVSKLNLVLAKAKQAETATQPESGSNAPSLLTELPELVWNAEQLRAIDLALEGKSFCLIGPAGTGKTATQKGVMKKLLQANQIPPMRTSTKFLEEGSPGIAIVAFTRRARNNIRKYMPTELKKNCLTIHQLIEYEPVKETREQADGEYKEIQVFRPQRNISNPLPTSLKILIIEEASMVGLELYANLMNAIKHNVQILFLGDIQQLPPIYDSAILGYKLLELPVVALHQVYRQAEESNILNLAHHILRGATISPKALKTNWQFNDLTIKTWVNKESDWEALRTMIKACKGWLASETYNPDTDMILCPFNKAVGTIELNKALMQHLGELREAVVFEVIAGYIKHYLAVGDKVMYDKEDAVVKEIKVNHRYVGAQPLIPSANLTRWGHYKNKVSAEELAKAEDEEITIDDFLDTMSNVEDYDKTNQASHTVVIDYLEGGTEELSSAGQINKLLGGYALTVHKAQGCEWRRVFLLLHRSHAVALKRELLYTAITRAKEQLFIICEQDAFVTGVARQAIKGNTLTEKAEFFKGKQGAAQTKLLEALKGR